jgi:hypothetical protein
LRIVSCVPYKTSFSFSALHELVAATNLVSGCSGYAVNLILQHSFSVFDFLNMIKQEIIPVDFPPVGATPKPLSPIDFKGRTVLVISSFQKWYSNGLTWESETGTGGSSTPIDANTPISGLPAALDTPGEQASALQALQATTAAQAATIAALQAQMATTMQKSVYDTDNDNRVDANRQQSNEYPFLAPLLVWNISHNLGKRATAILLDSTGVEFLSEITYSDANTIIIRHSAPTAGMAILQ